MRYMVIRTEQLTRTFGPICAVDNLTMEVEPGEVYGLLGLPGSGKTTLIRLLLDMLRPTSGRAMVLFLDSRRHSLEIRKQVGYIPSRLYLDPHLTAGEMLSFLASLRGGAVVNRARSLATELALDLHAKISDLPPGERQKIGLVQAFMHDPELLILDEPTRGLDAAARAVFYRWVAETRSNGHSVFFSTSSLAEAERICDRVGVLDSGRLVAVERAVQLRLRALRKIEMRFACPVTLEAFARLPNVQNLRLEDNLLRCTVQGDPDALIKTASQYRVTDFISQQPSLEEAFQTYYGVGSHAAA